MLVLKKIREEKGISRTELAKKMGVSFYTIWRWETGKREPMFKTLIQLAEILNCSTDELLGIKEG